MVGWRNNGTGIRSGKKRLDEETATVQVQGGFSFLFFFFAFRLVFLLPLFN